jgi:hypothetical protein
VVKKILQHCNLWKEPRTCPEPGRRAESANFANVEVEVAENETLDRKVYRSRWAAMIKKVYEIDPMKCPKCGEQMRIIAMIEKRDQPDVVKKILQHCDLWKEPKTRAPPTFTLEHEYIPMDEFLADF